MLRSRAPRSPLTCVLGVVLFTACSGSDEPGATATGGAPSVGGAGGSAASSGGAASANGGAGRPGSGGAFPSGSAANSGGSVGVPGSGSADGSGGTPCETNTVSINDGTTGDGLGQFAYAGAWSTGNGDGKYLSDDHYTAEAGASVTLRFTGTSIALHAARAPHHGIASVSLDGDTPEDVDLHAPTRFEDVEVWKRSGLGSGTHEIVLSAAGRHVIASSGQTVALDRAVVETSSCTAGMGGATGSGGASGSGGAQGTGGTSSGGAQSAGGNTGSGGAQGTGGSANPPASETMKVQGRHLYTHCGEKIVMRGVNHPTIYVDRAGAAIPEIARTGANAVRLFWFAGNGVAIGEADGIIARTIQSGMIPILEMHDATGPDNWTKMPAIVSYWTSSASVNLIQKYRAHLIVNIANEAGPGKGQDYGGYETVYKNAITSLRNAGIEVPLMIDASGWGRDHEVLFSRGPALIAHDPLHNVILSAHLYDVMDRAAIAAVYQRAVTANLPFILGEFANKSPIGTCGPALDYKALIGEAESRGIGWLAWSWGNNDPNTAWNTDCAEFDMTRTFAFDTLQGWGREVAVTDANSIQNTSERVPSLSSTTCP